ncbi:WD40 repeat-like protein [Tothia fuscella]|uniref:WD40 repeat-like protein n=1 Tax=Tothia fuscella TaxID=1048955 RepID=A0A9P4NTH9_9PEZI|nr:WD40 repeat-like protein [Tothia fuscella]
MEDIDDGDDDAEGDDGEGEEGEGEGEGEDGDGEEGDGEEGEGEEGEDGEGENEDDEGEGEGDNENEEEEDEPESPTVRTQNRLPSRPITSPRPLVNGTSLPAHSRGPSGTHPTVSLTSPSPHPTGLPYRPSIRLEAISAATYDIVPTIAAPHSTSINVVTATPDMRYVFSGGTDGYIRKFNWVDSVNGKLMLTVAQRHPFVDSVTKAGVLLSYWENEDSSPDTPSRQSYEDPVHLSPVYSLAVQNQALWLLSGTETGTINIQTVRHNEGTRIATLRGHNSAVSVLNLSQDERSVLSGSWDKTIIDWDLSQGVPKRTFRGSGGQISAIEMRPESKLPIPADRDSVWNGLPNGTLESNNSAPPKTNGSLSNGVDENGGQAGASKEEAPGSPDDDMNSLFGDDDTAGLEAPSMPLGEDDADDEFSRAITAGLQQQNEDDAVADGDIDMTDANAGGPVLPPSESTVNADSDGMVQSSTTQQATEPPEAVANGVPASSLAANPTSEALTSSDGPILTRVTDDEKDGIPKSETIFLDASMVGTIRIWDRRTPNPIAQIKSPPGGQPWCMSACWSPDGNFIYAGRRNNAVDEYSLHKGFKEPTRTFKFPQGSGPVSAVRCMPNGRGLVCASYDILRLYDLETPLPSQSRHSVVPFLIVPGHRTGVISQLYIDPTCTFLISTAGNRGWEGISTEVLLGYEIGCIPKA